MDTHHWKYLTPVLTDIIWKRLRQVSEFAGSTLCLLAFFPLPFWVQSLHCIFKHVDFHTDLTTLYFRQRQRMCEKCFSFVDKWHKTNDIGHTSVLHWYTLVLQLRWENVNSRRNFFPQCMECQISIECQVSGKETPEPQGKLFPQ